MNNDVFKQSLFSRSLINDRKLGAYYTDLEHCKRIGNLFAFPIEEEVCVLEPSCGDAEAVLAVTGKKHRENIKIFGVELNPVTCAKLETDKKIDYLLNADFLSGIKVSHNCFSFCFCNPPYGEHQEEKKRLETLFVDKLAYYLAFNGVLALVIPYYVFTSEQFLRTYLKWFQPLAEFRFDDDVYSQFQQVVVIGMKRVNIGYLREFYQEYYSRIDKVEKLPYLPTSDQELKRIRIIPSSEEKIEYFTTIQFDPAKASAHLSYSPLYNIMESRIYVPEYQAAELGRPPVPLKKDLIYLIAISGGGQGLVGDESNGDLHLQRGVVKTVQVQEVLDDELVERTHAKVCLNIIQNDGSISVLE